MSRKPVNAIPGKKGFQKTGRSERGKAAPTSAPAGAKSDMTETAEGAPYANAYEQMVAARREGVAGWLASMNETTLRERIWHTDTALEKMFPAGPKRGEVAAKYAEYAERLRDLMGEADRRGLVDADGNLSPAPARPAYRKEWTNGARAYPEADTFAGLKESMKRKRNTYMVHMPNSGEAGAEPCSCCGVNLGDPYRVNSDDAEPTALDMQSTWTVNPKTKTAFGQHYYCSWGSLMQEVFDRSRDLA